MNKRRDGRATMSVGRRGGRHIRGGIKDQHEDESLLTVPEVARLCRLSPKTIYAWEASGRIPCILIGNRIRFDRRDVLRWLEARKKGGDDA